MYVETSHAPRDLGLSSAASDSLDFDAWLIAWRQEVMFFRIDLGQRIGFASPSVQAILGYEPEELLGRDYREYFDLDHPLQAQLVDLSDRAPGGDRLRPRRCVARRRNGRLAFLALRQRDVHGPEGDLVGKEFMGQDVTAQVEAELSLRQSERKYRRLVEGVKGDYVIYSSNPDGVLTYVSPSVKNVLGYDPDALVGRVGRDFLDPSSRGRRAERSMRQAELGDQYQKYVVVALHADGSPRKLEIQERPVFALDGRLAAMEGIAKDVTEAAAAAEEVRALKEDLERHVALRTEQLTRINEDLQASETRYRDVVENQTEFIVRWQPDGTRTFVNEAYCRFRHQTREDMLGTSFFPLLHPEDRQLFDETIAEITPENPSAGFEVRVFRTDGSMAWNQWVNRGFFNEHGEVVEYQSVGRDVTELKEAADQLRQKEAHLAHLSRLATMGEMVAGIAHEVSQPLHAAKTFAEAARRNLESRRSGGRAAAIECMGEISHAVTRTVQIIRRLREFTKARPVKLETLSLNAGVRGAADIMAYEIRRVGATVKLQLSPALPSIVGDRVQLEQLCVNLLKNACEAVERVPSEARQITVCTSADEKTVRLTVSDTGCGVDPSNVDKLFDAFYSTKEQGMGMGLSLCNSIAKAHRGGLRFESNGDGPGATFVLTLPASGAKML